MKREIQIGDKTVAFLSNGVTPLFYKQLFKKDLLQTLKGNGEWDIVGDHIPELAFIRAMQAQEGITAADMMKLSYESYIEWLSQFEALDITMHGGEITNIYISDSIPSAEPKKKGKGKANA